MHAKGRMKKLGESKEAKPPLREDERRFRNLVELSSESYWEQDEQYRFKFVTIPLGDDTGVDPSYWLGYARWERGGVPLGDGGSWEKHIAMLDAHLPYSDFIYKRANGKGDVRYMSSSGRPTFDENGRFIGYCGIAKDVTSRIRTELRATIKHGVTRVLAESNTITQATAPLLRTICETLGWVCGARWEANEDSTLLTCKETWGMDSPGVEEFLAVTRKLPPLKADGSGLVRMAFAKGAPVWIDDVAKKADFLRKESAAKAGLHGAFAFPIKAGTRIIGGMEFYGPEVQLPDMELLRGMMDVGSEIGQFCQRTKAEEALRASEEKYRTILESIEDSYYECDLRGNFVFFNSAFCRLLGYPERRLLGTNNREYMTAEAATKIFVTFNDVYRTGLPAKGHDWEMIRSDGTKILVEGSVQLVKNVLGQPVGFRGMARDVTARRHMELALRESESRFRALTELSSDWYWEQDEELRFTRVEGEKSEHGFASESMLGQRPWEAGFEPEMEGGWNAVRPMLDSHQLFRDLIVHKVMRDGKRRYASVSGEPMFDAHGRFTGYRGVSREITEKKLAEERIQYLATHDGLTGLPNRMMFSQLVNIAIESGRRYNRPFAVLFIDLDRFKTINDTLGHEAGDKLLQEIAGRLKQLLRASDIVARLGGDEFVVLVPEVNEPSQVAAVARKILSAVIKPIVLMGQECRVTASIGIAMYPTDADDEQSLMKNADMAMYIAKEEGKNNFQFYSKQIKTQSLERLTLETNLRRALERNEFSLHYQAKVDLKTGAITGVEALLRWQNPELGSVSPAHFIPLAEETGLIVPIGKWVLKTACEQNMAWQRQGLPSVCMAVNLSARQFADPDLLADIAGVLKQTGMVPELLELEITEGMVIHNPARAVKLLSAIKRMGVRLAIDDFGTGYSSLGQLKHFPIDTLKVDRSFIREIPNDTEDKAITEAIIAMGKTLSLTVVAEGVETEEQARFLRERACDEMQGYYFSKPVAPEKFAELLREHVPVAAS